MAKKVLIFGKFDIIHPGHIVFIQEAKELGQVTVVLEPDQAIYNLNGYETFYKESVRKKQLEKLGLKVLLRRQESGKAILASLKPDLVYLSEDQEFLKKLFADLGFRQIKIRPLFEPQFFKSSKLRPILSDKQARFYLLDKKRGENSFKSVSVLRKILNIRRIGFSGTLDPLASGLMILAAGKATKMLDWFHLLPKVYQAEILFGAESPTFDLEVEPTIDLSAKSFSRQDLEKVLYRFLGRQKQQVPIFSAKKVRGVKLHSLARQGQQPKAPTKEIEIYDLKIKRFKYPRLYLEVSCSAGTYIRSLAHDLGRAMQTGAVLANLKRSQIGGFSLSQSLATDSLNKPKLAKKSLKPQAVIDTFNSYFLGLTK